jgi:hypothetical protein
MSGLGVSRPDSGGLMTFLSDDSGDAIALSDPSGAVRTQYSYGPFGAVSNSGTSSTNPFQFRETQNDGTGLNYASAAGYFSPAVGLSLEGGTVSGGGFNNISPSGSDIQAGKGSCGKCRYEMRYNDLLQLDIPKVGPLEIVHSFWYAKGSQYDGYAGGIPNKKPKWYNYLTGDWGDMIITGGDRGGTLAWPPAGATCDSDSCQSADKLLDFAWHHWPSGIKYGLLLGPNCNSAARALGQRTGLDPIETWTMEFEGWGTYVPGVDP